jgi:DNA-binding SARP family transcriptional activator
LRGAPARAPPPPAALRAGDLDEAQERLGRALRLHLEIADAWGLALDLEWLSELAARRGRHADAVRLMGAVDTVRSRVAIVILGIDRAGRAAREAAARARLGEAGFAACYAEGATLGPDALLRLAADDSSVHTAEHRVVAPAGRDAAPTAPVPAIAPPPPAPPQRAPASRDVVAPLRVRALGALEVSVGERAIEAAAWGSARTRELLVFLLAHPEGVTKEQVGVALWPDASTSQLRNNFHVTLHRLRKALGSAEWVALDGERYRVDAAPGVEFDAAIFEEEATAACRALARGGAQAPAAADALARALATYRGDFLAGEPAGDWHQAWRERLQRVCVDGWLALGAHRAATGDAAAAAEAYRQALGRDALCEEAVRGLMRAHAALGERPQALRVYQRFATLLAAELEVEPDDETVELFAQVQAS